MQWINYFFCGVGAVALDHYVSQVHLRNFYAKSTELRKMFAYRKSDGNSFICGSADVCRIELGSTNEFLSEPRVLEEFLQRIEPNYNRACQALADGSFSMDDVIIVAGFAAFIIGTSPTAMRLGSESLTKLVHTEIELMDRIELLDLAPLELGRKTATELLAEGQLNIETDVKYPQAMGIAGIIGLTKSFSTFHWEILVNRHSANFPFVTSDFPASIEGLGRQVPANRIVPLRPDLAVRILPQIRPPGRPDLESDFRYQIQYPSPSEIRQANLATVRCAENLVFSPVQAAWAKSLVAKNSRFRMELVHHRVPKGTGYMLLNSVVVKEREG